MENEKGCYLFHPKTSVLPLTMGGLIRMMDTAELKKEYNLG